MRRLIYSHLGSVTVINRFKYSPLIYSNLRPSIDLRFAFSLDCWYGNIFHNVYSKRPYITDPSGSCLEEYTVSGLRLYAALVTLFSLFDCIGIGSEINEHGEPSSVLTETACDH